MPLVIGIDIGTYEAKGVVVDAEGHVVASASRSHRLSVERPGFAEHDAEDAWWGGLVELVGRLLAAPGVDAADVRAICCSGIGPCVLPVDEAGRPLRPAILYGVDTRASDQIDEITRMLGDGVIRARSGNRLSSQSAGPKIAWIHDNEPEIHRAARRFVTSQTFLVGRLTGRWVVDHGSAGYFHPLYDLRSHRWNVAGCESFITEDALPELAWAGEIAGRVTATAAAATGLPEGLPVLVGSADAPMEALSCGVLDPGDLMLMYGSSHFLIEMVDEAVVSEGLYAAPYLFEGSFVLAAGTSTAGTITRWFVDLLGLEQSVDGEVFAELAAQAEASPPGARGLLALPHFSGERTPLDDPLATGGLLGLTLAHTRADVYRALLEGVAQGVRAVLEQYERAGAMPRTIRAVGGGTKNGVWTAAVSDISGVRQAVVTGSGASYGDAMLAALAVGLVPDRAALADWVAVDREIEPRRELAALYARQSELWSRLQHSTIEISHELRATFPGGAA